MVRRVRKDAWKQKKWFKVTAPTMFEEAEIGETPGSDANAVLGRRMETTLKELTGNIKKGSRLKLYFEIESVSGSTAKTRFHSLELVRSYVRSMVRRRISRIDPMFRVDTKDSLPLRVKALLITNRRVRSSIKSALRKETEKIISGMAKEKDSGEFIKAVAEETVVKDLKIGLHHIYPLKKVEIRRIETIKPKANA